MESTLAYRPVESYFTDEDTMVKIYVGEQRKLWVLPKGLLCDKIKYFSIAFNGLFKEGIEKEIHMVEDDPVAFSLLVNWLFLGKVDCWARHTPTNEATHQLELCKLFLLADKLALPGLRDEVLEAIETCLMERECCPVAESIAFAYEHGSVTAKLRESLIRAGVTHFRHSISMGNKAMWIKAVGSHQDYHREVMDEIVTHMVDNGWGCNLDGVCLMHQLP